MDLSEKLDTRLREILAPFIAASRRAGRGTAGRTRRSPSVRPLVRGGADMRPSVNGQPQKALRSPHWGRIAYASVREAYQNGGKNRKCSADSRERRRSRPRSSRSAELRNKKVADPFTGK